MFGIVFISSWFQESDLPADLNLLNLDDTGGEICVTSFTKTSWNLGDFFSASLANFIAVF